MRATYRILKNSNSRTSREYAALPIFYGICKSRYMQLQKLDAVLVPGSSDFRTRSECNDTMAEGVPTTHRLLMVVYQKNVTVLRYKPARICTRHGQSVFV